jgi:hypothetical protein
MIVTADWHLDDRPENDYRWAVFKDLERIMLQTRERDVFILGDLCDRKDKHSGELVNRLLTEFHFLTKELDAEFHIIMGNHDTPISGVPFWKALNYMEGQVNFWTEPHAEGRLLLLPYTQNPREAWKDIDLQKYDCAMIHQPIKGASTGHHWVIDQGSQMPVFPRGLKVYAGDIHYPQTIGRVTYVGAPYRHRFGDIHTCRMLLVNDGNFTIDNEVLLEAPVKEVVTISDVSNLDELSLKAGDMLRVKFQFDPGSHSGFPVEVERIREWGRKRDITIASVEGVMDQTRDDGVVVPRFDANPAHVLNSFCEDEGLDEGLVEAGHWLLRK